MSKDIELSAHNSEIRK